MKTTSEIVDYLTEYFRAKNNNEDSAFLSEEIDDLIREMGEVIQARLSDVDMPYQVIWDEFTQAPEENAASLAGALEALFEAQPAVRERVDGFMRAVTAIEAEQSDLQPTEVPVEDSLKSEPGGLVPDEGEASQILADHKLEKNPPAYLYNNEREGFESDRQEPVSKPFMVGKNAQIIYVPTEEVQFPFMFMHLGRLSETSEDLKMEEKEIVSENLQEIRFQLTQKRAFDEEKMANAFERIWEVAPSYANALIESLQRNIDELPPETRHFIIQLHSPLH